MARGAKVGRNSMEGTRLEAPRTAAYIESIRPGHCMVRTERGAIKNFLSGAKLAAHVMGFRNAISFKRNSHRARRTTFDGGMALLKSLVARITMLCCVTMTLITAVFIAANQFAMSSMRNQVIDTHAALLSFYTQRLEDSLNSLRIEMAQYIADDVDLITLSIYSPTEDRYKLNIQACRTWLMQRVNTSETVETHFIYAANSSTLLTASQTLTSLRHRYLNQHIDQLLEYADTAANPVWKCMPTVGYLSERMSPGWVLIKAAKASDQITIGTIVSIAGFLPPLQSIGDYNGIITLVYDQSGTLLASSEYIDEEKKTLYAAIPQDVEYTWVGKAKNGEDYAAINTYMETAPLRFVTLLPESEVLKPLKVFRQIAAYLPVLMLAMVIIMAFLIRGSLQNPFREMIRVMGRVSAGDLAARLPPGKTTEFVWLNAQFNDMVRRIGDLNRDVAEQTERAHRAEIRHLQAQINPHFYQNTLNLIYSLAALKKYDLIQKTALYLADYFRFIMRSGDEMISIEDELKHIANYMELQKIRYPNAIEYLVSVEAALRERSILPLLIQPFVENSVIHGYTTQRLFRIDVRVYGKHEIIAIEIEDNGKGMDSEMIERLNGIMNGTMNQQERHIGVWNVVSRLYRYYGASATLAFLEKDGPGTFVHIELPMERPHAEFPPERTSQP